MARISLDPPKTLGYRIGAMCHRSTISSKNHALKDQAVMAASARIGCAWCMDFGYWELVTSHRVPAQKIRAVPHWRDSGVSTELERLIMDYAEAMTATPPEVTDEQVERLGAHFSEAQLVELTAIVAVENLRSRTNASLGLSAQGFKERCEIPAANGAAAGTEAARTAAAGGGKDQLVS